MLAAASKLRETDFSISQDYSKNVRFARKKLVQFARDRGGSFKLNFTKLTMGHEVFIYDSQSQSVIRASQ